MGGGTTDGATACSPARFPFEAVASLCEDFTREWCEDVRPDLNAYLDRADAGARATLLRNLLTHEIRRRREAGEVPRADEYIAKVPTHAGLVREVFLESSASLSATGDDAAPPSVNRPRMAADRLGDYRLIRELGRGGMGIVHEAVHLPSGHRVALKLLPQVDGTRLYRFKREFRSASGLSHPNLIGLHNLEADGDQWFFTMDLIEGEDFLQHVRPSGRLDEPRLRSTLAQVVLGVMALHARQIIHRDLKPSNVMVARNGRAVLLDFGLVLELDREAAARSLEGGLAGTPAYMAPEQVNGGAVTSACDWYAVGVMLYEALSGRRPFSGGVVEILQAKLRARSPAAVRGRGRRDPRRPGIARHGPARARPRLSPRRDGDGPRGRRGRPHRGGAGRRRRRPPARRPGAAPGGTLRGLPRHASKRRAADRLHQRAVG